MNTVVSIIIALIIFGLLVLIHEFGHFIVAKKCGVVINEFSIGMGPRLWSKVAKSGTRYSIKALPLGGSCAMLGEDQDNDEEGSFNSKPLWARMAIVFAGPFFNFILAFLLGLLVIGYNGADISYVTKVSTDSPAYEAGLREGDEITEFNGASISIGREMFLENYVNPLDGEDVTLSYISKADGKEHTITYSPIEDTRYMMGISYANTGAPAEINQITKDSPIESEGARVGDEIININGVEITSGKDLAAYFNENPLDGSEIKLVLNRNGKDVNISVKPIMSTVYSAGFGYNMMGEKQSFGGVLKYGFVEVRYEIKAVLKSLKMLVTGKVSANEVSGPVGIVSTIGDTYTETSSQGFMVTLFTMLSLAVMLSANLGVMNLLPIPALDGGRLFLYIVELIIRKPIPKDKEGMIHFIGFILLMGLMVFLIFNDVRKLIF